MAAAVADYMPEQRTDGKIEKSDRGMGLTLVPTPDILAAVGRARTAKKPVLIGFAAQSGDPVARGREKLARKGADMIVANDITRADAGFDSDQNAATLLTADGTEEFPLGPKAALAAVILDRAERMLARVAS
jgi:phosphopantothenoylcysteine decarboxylase/phosphopantothenate--cysteine ligase